MLKPHIANARFVLIDAAMAGGAHRFIDTEPGFPAWAVPLYRGAAAPFGPLVIDVRQALDAGGADQLAALVAALTPALHVSLIQSHLSCRELAQHLRRFIFVNTASGDQLTLHLADCDLLADMLALLTPVQRALLCGPIALWMIHQADGQLAELTLFDDDSAALAGNFEASCAGAAGSPL